MIIERYISAIFFAFTDCCDVL